MSRTARVAVGLLLVAAALSGCNILAGDPGRTVTPAPVPTSSPTATPVPTVVPGISQNGTVKPSAVVARHQEAVLDRSHTFTFRRTVTTPNGTYRETYARAWVARNASTYRLVQYVNESRPINLAPRSQPAVDLYYDGATAFYRVTDSSGLPYVKSTASDRDAVTDPTFAPVLRDVFRVGRLRPTNRSTAGTAVRFVGVSPANESVLDPPPPFDDPRNVSLRVVVNSEGVVLSTRLSYVASANGTAVRVQQTTRVSTLGGTEVPVPSWASNRSATGE